MKITEVKVSAGRTFNHPHESYSNLRPHVELRATIEEGDDPHKVVKDLLASAEQIVEDHKQAMLQSIDNLYQLTERQREMTTLQEQLGRAQSRLDQIRNQYPQLQFSLSGSAEEVKDDGLPV